MPISAPVQTPTPQKTRSNTTGSSAFFAYASVDEIAVAPRRPSHAPSQPNALQRSFESILARGLSAPQSADFIQRKSDKLPAIKPMEAEASSMSPDEFDDILEHMQAYGDDAQTPPENYGRQLRRLKAIRDELAKWEKNNANVAQEPGTFWLPKTKRRHLLLRTLKANLALEEADVRKQGHDFATKKHQDDTTSLFLALNEGSRSGDRRLKNSCDWIRAGKTNLYAVTRTGDSEARIEQAGMSMARDAAFFPNADAGQPGHVLDAPSTYNKDNLADNTGVRLEAGGATTQGWNGDGFLAIVNASAKDNQAIWATLRHEVQHDADKHAGRDALEGVHAAGEQFDAASTAEKSKEAKSAFLAEHNLSRYKTEYRAYSYMGTGGGHNYDQFDNTEQSETHDGYKFSPRQLEIFKQIYKGYEHTSVPWDDDATLSNGTKFRKAVSEYWNADTEGMNKYNSPRVDDFVRALDAVDSMRAHGLTPMPNTLEASAGAGDIAPVGATVSDPGDASVVTLLTQIDALSQEDADAIVNEQPALMKKIKKHVAGKALEEVLFRLQKQANGPLVGEGMFG